MSQRAYAAHAGVSGTTVRRWLDAGRITAEADGRIDPDKADRQRAASESPAPQHQARKRRAESDKHRQRLRSAVAGGEDDATALLDELAEAEDLSRQLKRETLNLQRAKAQAANLALDKEAGLLVERSEVDTVLKDLAAHLQSRLANMPGQLAPELARHRGDLDGLHQALSEYGRDLLEDLAARTAEQARRRLGGVSGEQRARQKPIPS
jgi:phage terminase Nu1 subunit (DNA packaging protein)